MSLGADHMDDRQRCGFRERLYINGLGCFWSKGALASRRDGVDQKRHQEQACDRPQQALDQNGISKAKIICHSLCAYVTDNSAYNSADDCNDHALSEGAQKHQDDNDQERYGRGQRKAQARSNYYNVHKRISDRLITSSSSNISRAPNTALHLNDRQPYGNSVGLKCRARCKSPRTVTVCCWTHSPSASIPGVSLLGRVCREVTLATVDRMRPTSGGGFGFFPTARFFFSHLRWLLGSSRAVWGAHGKQRFVTGSSLAPSAGVLHLISGGCHVA